MPATGKQTKSWSAKFCGLVIVGLDDLWTGKFLQIFTQNVNQSSSPQVDKSPNWLTTKWFVCVIHNRADVECTAFTSIAFSDKSFYSHCNSNIVEIQHMVLTFK